MDMKKLPIKAMSIITLSGLLLSACDDTRVRITADNGPRHYGPSHHGGYLTHTPHNHRVSFDATLGMYVVLGLMNTYWNNGHYYRLHDHGWQRSPDFRRWSRLNHRHVPPRLYTRHPRRVTRNDRIRIVKPRRNPPNVHWIY